jgi:hypothetical protein
MSIEKRKCSKCGEEKELTMTHYGQTHHRHDMDVRYFRSKCRVCYRLAERERVAVAKDEYHQIPAMKYFLHAARTV